MPQEITRTHVDHCLAIAKATGHRISRQDATWIMQEWLHLRHAYGINRWVHTQDSRDVSGFKNCRRVGFAELRNATDAQGLPILECRVVDPRSLHMRAISAAATVKARVLFVGGNT